MFNRSVSLKDSFKSKEELSEKTNEGPEVTDLRAFTKAPWGGYFFRFSSRIAVITAPNNTPAAVQMTQLRSGGTSSGSFSRKAYPFFAAGLEQRHGHGHQQSAQSGSGGGPPP